ncbi:MAG: hypothetical protein H0W78_15400 [Planctomycetes bacterium]|nr:hypothetical protein [Planctomycetota bacterium]
MITPYPPPPGPRVELLRVRRVAPTAPVERSGPSPLRDPGDLAVAQPARINRVEISECSRAQARLIDPSRATTQKYRRWWKLSWSGLSAERSIGHSYG